MISIKGNTRLDLVQGDNLVLWIDVDVGMEQVTKMTFTCPELNILSDFDRVADNDKNGFGLNISSQDTDGYPVGLYWYSVYITLFDGRVKTVIYQNDLNVLPRKERYERY